MAVVEYVVGASGTGKSYVRGPVALFDYWLPCTSRTIWTNLPFDLAAIKKECVKHPEWADRIQLIPEEELQRWKHYESGPWDFFTGDREKNVHILLDEAQNYFADEPLTAEWQPAHSAYLVRLNDWLGQHLRKNNASFECLTQSPHKLCNSIKADAGLRRQMLPANELSYWGFRLQDYAGVWSKIYGKKQGVVSEVTETRQTSGAGEASWKRVRTTIYWLSEYNWRFYNSYNKPGTGLDNGVKPDPEEWQILSWPAYLYVLWQRYFILLAKSAAIVGFVLMFAYMLGNVIFNVGGVLTSKDAKKAPSEPTPVDDPVWLAQLEKKGLPKSQADRLTWPDAAIKLTQKLEDQNRQLTATNVLAIEREQKALGMMRTLFERLQKQSEFVALVPDGAIQRDGTKITIGEVVTAGLFEGRKLEAVDGDTLVFDGGLRVRPSSTLGGTPQYTYPATATAPASPRGTPLDGSPQPTPVDGYVERPTAANSGPASLTDQARNPAGSNPEILSGRRNFGGVLQVSGAESQSLGGSTRGSGTAPGGRRVLWDDSRGTLSAQPSPASDGYKDRRQSIRPRPATAN